MGKNVLISMLIMSMLLNVAVGFFDPLKNVANQAQKGVQDIAKQALGRKTMEENGEEQLQVAGDCDQDQNNAGKVNEAKFFFNPFDPIANFKQGANKERKTMEEDDRDCDQDHGSENNAESNENGNGNSDDTNDASDANDASDCAEGQDIKENLVNAARKIINQHAN